MYTFFLFELGFPDVYLGCSTFLMILRFLIKKKYDKLTYNHGSYIAKGQQFPPNQFGGNIFQTTLISDKCHLSHVFFNILTVIYCHSTNLGTKTLISYNPKMLTDTCQLLE